MKTKWYARLGVLCLLLALLAPGGARGQQGGTTAFVGVSVIPMDTERVLENQTVIVRGDRIVALGPASRTAVPRRAARVDGRGKFLLPGLAEMHGHVPPPSAPAQQTDDVLFLYLANGITTVRGMLGAPNQLALRERAKRGTVLSPHLYLAGPSFNGSSVDSPEEAARKVREQKREGWDLLKVHPGLTRAEYDAMARTAREVGIRFGGHVPAEVGILRALEAGQETFDHLDGYLEHLGDAALARAPRRFDDLVRRTREAGAWVVPTMALWEVILGASDLDSLKAYPELKYMPRNTVQQWIRAHEQRQSAPGFDAARTRRVIQSRNELLRALHQGGARILMGTDAPQQFSVPGFSLHRELTRMRAAGMSPYEILVTGTRNVGEYFKNADRFGTVAVGQRADLILVEENPLEDLSHLTRRAGVMVGGRWIPETQIRARLKEIEARYRE
jgi:imidazolonepropionase-like amidohydrolase